MHRLHGRGEGGPEGGRDMIELIVPTETQELRAVSKRYAWVWMPTSSPASTRVLRIA